MNIILCGMPGCGKSHYGRLAAQQLKRHFIDTDHLVEHEYFKRHQIHATCREIALKHGSAYFHELEHEIINSLLGTKKSMIAIGGGALCDPKNVHILKNLGMVLYIKTPKKILLERLMKKDQLPSYLQKDDIEGSFDQLLNKRLPLYEQNCQYIIDGSSDHVLEDIIHYATKDINNGK